MLIGWPSVNSFIAAISLSHVFGAAFGWPVFGQPGSTWPMVLGILLTAVAQGIITFLGHEAIRYLERVAGVLLLVLGGWVSYIVLSQWNLSDLMAFRVENPAHSVAFYIDLAFGFSWTWAQVADFSRFSRTGKAATLGSWLGLNVGQGWFMLIGAIGTIGVALQTGNIDPNNSDPSSTLATLGLGLVSFLVLIFATVSTNVTVLYGSGMGLLGAFKGLTPKKALAIIVVLQLGLCFVPMGFDSFLHYFETFLGVIGGLFIPSGPSSWWTTSASGARASATVTCSPSPRGPTTAPTDGTRPASRPWYWVSSSTSYWPMSSRTWRSRSPRASRRSWYPAWPTGCWQRSRWRRWTAGLSGTPETRRQ